MAIIKRALASDPPWLKGAFTDMGLTETVGKKHNPKVIKLYKDAGHPWVKDDETPWCGAFVGAWLGRVDQPVIAGALGARNWLQWGKKTKAPSRGDVVVFKRGSGWQGHVAFYIGEDKGRIYHLGGNQRNRVSISSTPRSKLLGFRKPVTLSNSRTITAAAAAGSTLTAGVGTETYHLLRSTGEDFSSMGLDWLVYAGSALIMASLGVICWARYTDWRDKAR